MLDLTLILHHVNKGEWAVDLPFGALEAQPSRSHLHCLYGLRSSRNGGTFPDFVPTCPNDHGSVEAGSISVLSRGLLVVQMQAGW